MEFVQHFVAILVLSTQLVLISSSPVDNGPCLPCPAGEFQKSCTQCEPCTDGSYVENSGNHEERCHLCFRDCLPKYHLRVVQNCTRTTPLKCVCEPGFKCAENFMHSGNCKKCEKIQDTTVETVISVRDKHTASPPTSDPTKPDCRSAKCSQRAGVSSSDLKPDETNSQLAVIVGLVIFLGCMSLVILFYICRLWTGTCFWQTLAKLCNEGQDAAYKSKESTHQVPRESFKTKQQPSSHSAASLGSVHVHNPGTVIFSFLSHLTGQVGPTILSGKKPERESNEEDNERGCTVFHPTSSSSVLLSEEKRNRETDIIYSPFQEQGKDCHISKEEVL